MICILKITFVPAATLFLGRDPHIVIRIFWVLVCNSVLFIIFISARQRMLAVLIRTIDLDSLDKYEEKLQVEAEIVAVATSNSSSMKTGLLNIQSRDCSTF